jgi:hypothetical protein
MCPDLSYVYCIETSRILKFNMATICYSGPVPRIMCVVLGTSYNSKGLFLLSGPILGILYCSYAYTKHSKCPLYATLAMTTVTACLVPRYLLLILRIYNNLK